MKQISIVFAGILLAISCVVAGYAQTGGIQQTSVSSAKIEKVEFKPDAEGNFYIHVTMRNVSGKEQSFYLMIQAEDQPLQLTASGPRGEPNPVRAGETYTFQLNTLLKKVPKNVSIEIMDVLPR